MNDFRKIIESPKSYTEDYPLENGNYFNVCIECKETFCGYKMRVICKECISTDFKSNSDIEDYFTILHSKKSVVKKY